MFLKIPTGVEQVFPPGLAIIFTLRSSVTDHGKGLIGLGDCQID